LGGECRNHGRLPLPTPFRLRLLISKDGLTFPLVPELGGGGAGRTGDIASDDWWGGKVDRNRTCGRRSSNWEIEAMVTQGIPGEGLGAPDVLQDTGIVIPDAVPVGPDLGSHAPDAH